jgi:uncharacterized phage-like protein YoqJ
MSTNKTIVGFTGHRVLRHKPRYIAVELQKALAKLNPDGAISGMALGFDQLAARVCLRMKIKLIAAVPAKDQPKVWTPQQRTAYYQILDKAHKVVYVDTVKKYTYDNINFITKLHKRNEWIVDHATYLLAYQHQNKGGTINALKYAHDNGFRVQSIHELGLKIWENRS